VLWAFFVLTGVQILSVSENTRFSSTKSNIKISPEKKQKSLENQGFLRRYLFIDGFEPARTQSRRSRV